MIFLLCCLACWRICHFIAKEDGPRYLMWDIRYNLQDLEIWNLITCIACSSVWVSAPIALLVFSDHKFLYWLSISAVSMILEALYDMLRR
jgi:hypothetical protein